jgi:hypothetical protein
MAPTPFAAELRILVPGVADTRVGDVDGVSLDIAKGSGSVEAGEVADCACFTLNPVPDRVIGDGRVLQQN